MSATVSTGSLRSAPYDGVIDRDRIETFLAVLPQAGFGGDIRQGGPDSIVNATDNSIYQVLPAAVIYPRTAEDINIAVRLAAGDEFGPIPLTARGGGTGTNGQSLTRGVIIDTSRHLNRILDIDLQGQTVRVEPGVVLAQLNAFLAKHGLFFPPTVSTATRATIGGMVATDASGKGSRIYGKTSDYIRSMDVVLSDGTDFKIEPMSGRKLEELRASDTIAGRACRQVIQTVSEHADQIEAVFPQMNRGLTGYNLQKALTADGIFSLHRVLAGSEGTLALTRAVELRVMKKPTHQALVVVRYSSFEAGLSHVTELIGFNPLAVEIIDEKVIGLARQDIIWSGIGSILGQEGTIPIEAMNVIEFVGDSAEEVERQVTSLDAALAQAPAGLVDHTIVRDRSAIEMLWTLREKSVGLMGRANGLRQGIAFVEDAAVPPEALPAFIREFRAVLERHGLAYGMYGHADVGCLHVRPTVNMQAPEEAALIRPISDEIAALAKRHGGLLWGEHGRGYRGEYSPFFFGEILYGELRKIKAAFDPRNIFNPGKLSSVPGGPAIDAIDKIPLRGEFDRQIGEPDRRNYEKAMLCNGNGVCFSWNPADVMCPSYKATRDRSQSPKGRAALLREWARLRTAPQQDGTMSLAECEETVRDSLATCLSCKACASECPVQVDIPSMRSRFLDAYHKTRRRRVRDYFCANMESILPVALRFRRLFGITMGWRLSRWLLRNIGLIDLPSFSSQPGLVSDLDVGALAGLSEGEKAGHVIFVPDTFTSAFDPDVPRQAVALLRALGYRVHVAPLLPNGKALHVLGFRTRFDTFASRVRAQHTRYAATGVAMVGVEAVTVLMDRHEYVEDNASFSSPLKTIDEFLDIEISSGHLHVEAKRKAALPATLFLHCTEKAMTPAAGERWKRIFRSFGSEIEIQKTGCCGMAGLFGHEREHADMSRTLFNMSWANVLPMPDAGETLATGFSCRCQIDRFSPVKARHPVELLADMIA